MDLRFGFWGLSCFEFGGSQEFLRKAYRVQAKFPGVPYYQHMNSGSLRPYGKSFKL